MKEILNIRIDKDILDQVKNYQLLIGQQSGFVPSKTSVIEKLIVWGLEDATDNYEVWTRAPQGIDDDTLNEIQELASKIYGFTQAWLDNSNGNLEE